MTAQKLITMLQKLPPDAKIVGWIDGDVIQFHEVDTIDYCAVDNDAHINFLNTDE